jgi:SAM-dependent methyltransferase
VQPPRWPVDLVCPRDQGTLELEGEEAVCAESHRYPLEDGVPVLLVEEEAPTHGACWLSPEEQGAPPTLGPGVDPVVQELVAATCGRHYRHLVERLPSYPIPQLRLPPGEGRLFVEVGCNWGRWCIAAARQGYVPVGVDPSLRAIQAARRVARQLGVDALYVVADARRLPFGDATFATAFSYSVFQHFSKPDALASFDELGRVLEPGGTALVQMANVYGLRSVLNQARERRWREPRALFDVRYWSPRELREELERRVGPTDLAVDGFLTLNPQPTDLELLPRRYRALVRTSEALRRLAGAVPPLTYGADSLYALSRRGSSA